MRRPPLAVAASCISLLLAACSAHNALIPALFSTGQASPAIRVTVKITLATKSPAGARPRALRPRYFSPSSNGLLVRAYPHGKTKPIASVAVDIAPGSAACGKKKTTPRTCTATLSLPPSAGDDFAIGDYDLKPVRGKIPKTAHLLGYGKLNNEKISSDPKKNVFSVYLGGLIAGLSGNGFVSLPGDGSAHSLAIVVHPADFGNNRITGGTRDPFLNPIVVSLAESGGSGHMTLSLNGGAGAAIVTVKRSTDSVELKYDGKGSAGYGASVTLAAPTFKGAGGAVEAFDVSPLLLDSGSSNYSPGVLTLNGNGEIVTMTASELNAPSGTIYSVTPHSCYAIAQTTNLVQQSAASGNFIVFAGATISTPPPGGGCVLAVSDGTSTLDAGVLNRYVGSLGTPHISEPAGTSSSNPQAISVGADGNLWYDQCATHTIGFYTPVATSSASTGYTLPTTYGTPNPWGIAPGPDGAMWWSDVNSNTVGKITTHGTATQFPTSANTGPFQIVWGADNALWFTQCGTSGNSIGRITTVGTYKSYPLPNSNSDPLGITLGSDGNVWFAEYHGNRIGKITPGGVITEFPASGAPNGITSGPDGAIWFTEFSASKIGRIPVTATTGSPGITEYPIPGGGTDPEGITTGPDGAIWFNENITGKIGRLDPALAQPGTSNGITDYPVPSGTPAHPAFGINSGPDGAIWFTECGTGAIGRVKIATSAFLSSTRRGRR
jgi:virginiamycin B lyase